MEKTIDVSGAPMLALQYVLAGSFVFGGLFVTSFALDAVLSGYGVSVPYLSGLSGVVAFAALWLVLTALWVRHLRRADGEWWGPVPRDQYLGRFAGYGGLARHSWERSVEQLYEDGDGDDRRE